MSTAARRKLPLRNFRLPCTLLQRCHPESDVIILYENDFPSPLKSLADEHHELREQPQTGDVKTHNRKKVFVNGAIPAIFIGDSIAKHSSKTSIGAHSIFLGQVRADIVECRTVAAIDYTAYTEMAEDIFHEIRESTFASYPLTCLHIYHSLGLVEAGA